MRRSSAGGTSCGRRRRRRCGRGTDAASASALRGSQPTAGGVSITESGGRICGRQGRVARSGSGSGSSEREGCFGLAPMTRAPSWSPPPNCRMKSPLQLEPPHDFLEKMWLLYSPLLVPSVCWTCVQRQHARAGQPWAAENGGDTENASARLERPQAGSAEAQRRGSHLAQRVVEAAAAARPAQRDTRARSDQSWASSDWRERAQRGAKSVWGTGAVEPRRAAAELRLLRRGTKIREMGTYDWQPVLR